MASPQEELDALRTQVAALTARVHRLEQGAGIQPPAQVPVTPPPASTAPPPPPLLQPRPAVPGPEFLMKPALPSGKKPEELEGKIGKLWLNRIGIVAVLFGVAYFIMYAFDKGWITPRGRVAVGLIVGTAVIRWSERFRKKNYLPFSFSLKAVGVGTLYLSLWGAFHVYNLIPSSVAFVAMILVTAFTVVLAVAQDAEILAAYALIGGFITPVLVSTGENHEIVLFSYIALLDLAMLALVMYKPWRRLMWGSFAGTVTLYVGWYTHPSFYSQDVRGLTVFFAALFAAIFAAIPLVTPLQGSRWHKGQSITLTLLPVFNAGLFFLALFDMYESEKATLTWYALGLAAVYLGLASLFRRRADAEPDTLKLINLLHVAIAIAFITIAIPLKANAHWITIGWLVESAALLLIAVRTNTDFLRYFSGATLALGVARLLIIDSSRLQPRLMFNARFATYLVAVAILAGIVAAGERMASKSEMPWVKLAGVGLNLLALIGVTLEAHDYFTRAKAAAYDAAGYNDLDLAWNFSYSAIWLVYGAGMMAFGFWKRDSFVRWQALVLIALTVAKAFTYDTWSLDKVYRILSFIALGAVLMAISFIYQRDWLKLSPSPSDKTVKGTSA